MREVTLDVKAVTASTLLALEPVAGHVFGPEQQTCRGALVNEEAAKVLFGAGTVGRSLQNTAGRPIEIIGVLGARKGDHADAHVQPTIYFYQEDAKGPPPERLGLANFRAPIVSELEQVELDSNVVSPSYFAVMGWPAVAGQLFPEDQKPHGCRVGVVNQEAADLYFNGNAVGRTVIDGAGRRTEIIGVVHSAPLGTFERRVEPTIYFPMAQDFLPYMTLTLSAREVNEPLLAELRGTIEPVPGRGPAPVILKTLDTYLNQTALAPLRIASMTIGASATIALLLSILGLFGALSDTIRQRRREFAVRILLGAQRRHMMWQVLREGGRLASAGALAGTLGSLVMWRTLAGIIPGNMQFTGDDTFANWDVCSIAMEVPVSALGGGVSVNLWHRTLVQDGSAAAVGRLGCSCQRASCAPRVDGEPTHAHAGSKLTCAQSTAGSVPY